MASGRESERQGEAARERREEDVSLSRNVTSPSARMLIGEGVGTSCWSHLVRNRALRVYDSE